MTLKRGRLVKEFDLNAGRDRGALPTRLNEKSAEHVLIKL